MPIYEYRCDSCDQVFEIWQKITEDPATECPECGGPIERLISATAFQLKGSGWYATDYKKTTGPNGSGKPATSGSESKADSGSTDSSSDSSSTDSSSSSTSDSTSNSD